MGELSQFVTVPVGWEETESIRVISGPETLGDFRPTLVISRSVATTPDLGTAVRNFRESLVRMQLPNLRFVSEIAQKIQGYDVFVLEVHHDIPVENGDALTVARIQAVGISEKMGAFSVVLTDSIERIDSRRHEFEVVLESIRFTE